MRPSTSCAVRATMNSAVAVLLDLRPLMGVARVLDGEIVQAELALHPPQELVGRLVAGRSRRRGRASLPTRRRPRSGCRRPAGRRHRRRTRRRRAGLRAAPRPGAPRRRLRRRRLRWRLLPWASPTRRRPVIAQDLGGATRPIRRSCGTRRPRAAARGRRPARPPARRGRIAAAGRSRRRAPRRRASPSADRRGGRGRAPPCRRRRG